MKMRDLMFGWNPHRRWLPCVALAVVLGFAAKASPFWYGDAVPATNRMAVSGDYAVGATAVETHRLSVEWSAETTFTTYPCGLMMVIR